MSKKNFKAGFEDLFHDAKVGAVAENVAQQMKQKRTTSAGKSFAADLESLFEETMVETTLEATQAVRDGKTPPSKRPRKYVGIDALIRDTVASSDMEVSASSEGQKRIAITLEKDKLEKLKKIAQLQKSYLKDVISEVVAEYIAAFEAQHKLP